MTVDSSSVTAYDVAVVGASIGGCTTAKLFAERGLRVALLERKPDPDAYKTVCTHFIQASATPVIERLGLAGPLEEQGAIRNSGDMWTPYGGWIRTSPDDPYGYSITRRVLDPLLRSAAARTPGVDLLTGCTVTGLTGDGVELRDGERITARLVVGADGRASLVARQAGLRGRVKPHGRFFYWAYYRGVEPRTDRSRFWFMEPDCAYTFPNEDGLTLVAVAPHRDRLPEFRADAEGAYARMIASLPDAPRLESATRESRLLGKLDLPNVIRPAARPGVALVGDAAQASDPVWGVGCGWALQSAEWLVDQTADALVGGSDLDAALARYRRLHFRRLAAHHLTTSDLATGRPATPIERLFSRAAARDEHVVREFAKVGSRRASPFIVFRPRTLARVVRATA